MIFFKITTAFSSFLFKNNEITLLQIFIFLIPANSAAEEYREIASTFLERKHISFLSEKNKFLISR